MFLRVLSLCLGVPVPPLETAKQAEAAESPDVVNTPDPWKRFRSE